MKGRSNQFHFSRAKILSAQLLQLIDVAELGRYGAVELIKEEEARATMKK